MNNIKSFTIYREYFELLDELPLDGKKELSVAILDYVFKDTEPTLTGLNKAIFNNLRRPIDVSKNKSKSARKDNQEEIKPKSNENQIKIKRYNTSMMSMSMSNSNVNYVLVKGVVGEKAFLKSPIREKFENFWKLYPNKKSKQKVVDWFNKSKMSDELYKTIMDKLKLFVRLKTWQEVRYVPHPSTWLNQKRWEDEIDFTELIPEKTETEKKEIFEYDWLNEEE